MAVIFDIDGTLANARRREGLLPNWDAFHAESVNDEPIEATQRIAHALYMAGTRLIAITGRPEKFRDETLSWLAANAIPVESKYLLMRSDGDDRPSAQVKSELALKHCFDLAPEGILCVFEDHPNDVAMWKGLGFTVLQVNAL